MLVPGTSKSLMQSVQICLFSLLQVYRVSQASVSDYVPEFVEDLHALNLPNGRQIAVQLKQVNETLARVLAAEHDMQMLGKINSLEGHYIFSLGPSHKRAPRASHGQYQHTDQHHQMAAATLAQHDMVHWANAQRLLVRKNRANHGSKHGASMKIKEAWALGATGQGVTVTVLDDGIMHTHPDIRPNYKARASVDLNGFDEDPMPTGHRDNHGTRCASQVASVAGNGVCTVGIAYNASIGGVRMLSGPITDAVEAAAFGLEQQEIDIYSASWGPSDGPSGFEGPGPLAEFALKKGIVKGRRNLGNIFIFAGGNGHPHDACSFDGYVTSVFTVAVSGASWADEKSWFAEMCPAIIVTAHTSGTTREPSIVTAESPSGCTREHSGTSAAAPMVAGVVALMLDVNPRLNWRDVQHILVRTADPRPLSRSDQARWMTNGAGRRVNDGFGYGLINAQAAVSLSRRWKTVPEQRICSVTFAISGDSSRLRGSAFSRTFALDIEDECTDVSYLEHVTLSLEMPYVEHRGAVEMELVSPAGTRSKIWPARPNDRVRRTSMQHTRFWPFMSVQQWSESPKGRWLLQFRSPYDNRNSATITGAVLTLYGTSVPAQPNDAVHRRSRGRKRRSAARRVRV